VTLITGGQRRASTTAVGCFPNAADEAERAASFRADPEPSMKHCPNPECTVMATADGPAEFSDRIQTCPDCGTTLVEAPRAASPAAVPSSPVAQGRFSTRAPVLATLSVIAVVAILSATGIPGAVVHSTDYVSTARGLLNLPERQWTFLAVGLRPFFLAFFLVEVLALLIPSWRARRVHPERRAGLTRLAYGLGGVFALIQFAALDTFVVAISGHGEIDDGSQIFGVLAIIGGVLTCLGAIWALKRWPAIGNPFSMIILGSVAVDIGCVFAALFVDIRGGSLAPGNLLLVGGGLAAAVALGYFGVGTDLDRTGLRHPAPGSGLLPLWVPSSLLIAASSVLSLLGGGGETMSSVWMFFGDGVLGVALAVLLVPLSVWIFYRPALVGRAWAALGVRDASVAARRAFAASVRQAALFILLASFASFVLQVNFWAAAWLPVTTLVLVTAIAKDLVREWRFTKEHGALASAFSVQRLYLVEPALDLLREAGIDAFPRGLHHRSLELIFAPFVPVELLVPETQAAEARRLLDEKWPDA